ncbi:hypothetical protein HYC85_016755 [Camellia sinensis]|uniref:Uncharacterized protein n=1 Tax=Camellia sinensis TaxID=4442 RepID=A0A7J7H1R1_CAMSI|nr:hypothetical protein HYC85_016755 [Camellia sinensis]
MKSMYLVDLKLQYDFCEFEEIDWLIDSLSRYFLALQAVLFDVRKSKTKSMYLVTLFTRGKAPITQQLPGESEKDYVDFSSKKWVEIIGQARHSVDFLKDEDVIRTVLNILQELIDVEGDGMADMLYQHVVLSGWSIMYPGLPSRTIEHLLLCRSAAQITSKPHDLATSPPSFPIRRKSPQPLPLTGITSTKGRGSAKGIKANPHDPNKVGTARKAQSFTSTPQG